MNDRVYTHEFIDIIGANRANYMQHMTANWCPISREERDQLCFGVWGVVGTTHRWPRVVNMWEEKGLHGLADALSFELSRPTLQDPSLEAWWNEAASFRSGGFDRVMIPAPWTKTIEELVADGVKGVTYAHDTISLNAGQADAYLEHIRHDAIEIYADFGWQLVTAMKTSMRRDDECIVIWALPSWRSWADVESGADSHSGLRKLRDRHFESNRFERFLMCDAPLSPMKIGRQPERSDRVNWEDPS